MKKIVTILLFAQTAMSTLAAQNEAFADSAKQWWNLHTQLTVVTQHNFPFTAAYSGQNSFQNTANTETSITATLFLGLKLWHGAGLYINPEISGGAGLSSTLGIGGFPNGETFRVGNPKPEIYLARGYIKQTFNLKGNTNDTLPNEIAVSVGKISMADFFDVNDYAHDARTMFLNWSLMSHGAWDYPANTKGYTYAAIGEWTTQSQSVRAAIAMLPTDANGPDLNGNLQNSQSFTLEYERKFNWLGAKNRATITAFQNTAAMGNYTLATDRSDKDVTATRQNGRTKTGIGLSLEREIAEDSYVFLKGSWNDGKNETWAFTEIDNSIALGYSTQGAKWHRPDDKLGIAFATNGLSQEHAAYLGAGGYGFIIGDGKINYAREAIIEAYYAFQITPWCALSPDIQFIVNPGYNKDRGTVPCAALRFHAAI